MKKNKQSKNRKQLTEIVKKIVRGVIIHKLIQFLKENAKDLLDLF